MASSDQPSDRDDAVPPEPHDPDPPVPDTAAARDSAAPPRGTPEPDRGNAPRRRRVRVAGECLYWLVRLMLDLYDNGG
ncbi:hypothetical protein JCM4814A_19230 [Streptomyces phaeofaciens JCM 4814]|uniref:Uncharacterized protein n=1 Tax=Streptomyces phaeofaciens TaxID=68254 RepID=A0A918HE99_9ACTN|nr:hypothetical protein [Streptomyces phaeofaciens]GGT57192.1 hypothetical protein GCM10010226_38130 [Streptomyces phaeofaciens]